MAKTVSSAGLQEFIATGKPTQVFDNDQTSKRQAAESKSRLDTKLAVVDSGKSTEPPTAPPETKPEEGAKPPETPAEGSTATKTDPHEETDDLKGIPLSEAAQKRLDKWLAKRTAMTKTAQEEAAAAKADAEESERFAETVFNEREQWRKRAEEAEAKLSTHQPKPVEPPKKPEPKDFTDDKGNFRAIEYAEALSAWSAKEALEKRDKEAAERAQKEETERFNAQVRERIAAATQKYPDWEKKVTGSEVTLQNECLAYIARSPHGMDLAYYLADTPEEAKRIRALDPYIAVAELGQLAKRFEKQPEVAPAPKVETRNSAPPPITPISTSGTGTVQVDPAKMNFKELRAWHKERRRAGIER